MQLVLFEIHNEAKKTRTIFIVLHTLQKYPKIIQKY